MKHIDKVIVTVAGAASALVLQHKAQTRAKVAAVGGGLTLAGALSGVLLESPLGLFYGGGVVLGTGVKFALLRAKSQGAAQGGASARAPATKTSAQGAVTMQKVDAGESLKSVLQGLGIGVPSVPKNFKLVLDVYRLDGTPRRTRYCWAGASIDNTVGDWVPASAVKIFAALGALKRLASMGFGAGAQVTFSDSGQTVEIRELVERAIVVSDNMAYNRLVQLAGHEDLHAEYLARYADTELNTPYIKDEWRALTRGNTTFAAPEILVEEGGRVERLAPTPNRAAQICGGKSACTSPGDLNDAIFDAVIVTDPDIPQDLSTILVDALGAKKASGADFSNAIVSQMSGGAISVFGKHGFNGTTYTQTALIYEPDGACIYVVTATGEGGSRACLNDVGRAVGAAIASGRLCEK